MLLKDDFKKYLNWSHIAIQQTEISDCFQTATLVHKITWSFIHTEIQPCEPKGIKRQCFPIMVAINRHGFRVTPTERYVGQTLQIDTTTQCPIN